VKVSRLLLEEKDGIIKRIEVSDLDDNVVEKVNGEHKSIHPLKKESKE